MINTNQDKDYIEGVATVTTKTETSEYVTYVLASEAEAIDLAVKNFKQPLKFLKISEKFLKNV